MIEFAYVVMIGFLIFSPLLFLFLTIERALVVIFVAALMWLPQVDISVPFLKVLSHYNVPCLSALIGILISGSTSKARLSFNALDMPVLVAPLIPMASSLANGLGPYDGAAESTQYFFSWTVPFLLGRGFLATPEGSRLLARCFVVGALTYVVPCLIEIRLSPQIHYWFFGISLYGGMRLGGYRPAVFMETGLQLGLWMSGCAFVALCCYLDPFKQAGKKLIEKWQFWTVFLLNLGCRSTGALMILAAGIAAVLPVQFARSRLGLIGLLMVSPLFIATRLTGVWDGRSLVQFIETNFSEDRAQSLEFRIDNEDLLMEKAMQRPILGWGGWEDSRVFDEYGNDLTIVDSRWIKALGQRGITGLFCEYWTLLLPLLVVVIRWPTVLNCTYNVVAIVAISCFCTFFAIDCLSNNCPNPFFWLCAGAISGSGTLTPPRSSLIGDSQAVTVPQIRRSRQFWPPANVSSRSDLFTT